MHCFVRTLILSMLLLMPVLAAETEPATTFVSQEVRPLPGGLDDIPVFNSNSPEVVQSEGVLLSTFPPEGKATAQAHLNRAFNGRFDVFAHHIAKALSSEDLRTLYIGIVLHNPGNKPARVEILSGASYLSQPDAPFVPLPSKQDNRQGKIFAGPGDRVTHDVLKGVRQDIFPDKLTIAPEGNQLLLNMPIPVSTLTPPLNGRSTLIKLRSDTPVYVASLAMFGPKEDDGSQRAPSVDEWMTLLNCGKLAGPRDVVASAPGAAKFAYGRVAGVAKGTTWTATLTDRDSDALTIPEQMKSISYLISSVQRGTFGTGQVQSAPISHRYADAAYEAHGNYGIKYDITIPLYNPTDEPRVALLQLGSPLKTDTPAGGLTYYQEPPPRVFFRGTLKITYPNRNNSLQTDYVHVVLNRGQQSENLVRIHMKPKQKRVARVEFIYPPDATPPQVLTVSTEPWLY
jgi:hypothetical protein